MFDTGGVSSVLHFVSRAPSQRRLSQVVLTFRQNKVDHMECHAQVCCGPQSVNKYFWKSS
jgi:uncharacterized protein (UPF0179 family)